MQRRKAQKTNYLDTAEVSGFLLDACVVKISAYITELADLEIKVLPTDMRAIKDASVHGIAFGKEYIVISSDSGFKDNEGFCTLNGMEVVRYGAIFLPVDYPEKNAARLKEAEIEIILYLNSPDRNQFYLDLSADSPVMVKWGTKPASRSALGSKENLGDINKVHGEPQFIASDGGARPNRKTSEEIKRNLRGAGTQSHIECILTQDGLHIISGDHSKLISHIPLSNSSDPKGISIGITLHAADSPLLPKALSYIKSLDISGDYRVKSCQNGDLEVLSLGNNKKSIAKVAASTIMPKP